MKACVFVDGENLRHAIVDLFGKGEPPLFRREEYLPRDARWDLFFDNLAKQNNAVRLRTYWYVIDTVDASPWLLSSRQKHDTKDPERNKALNEWRNRHRKGIEKWLADWRDRDSASFTREIGDADFADDEGLHKILAALRRRRDRIESRFRWFQTVQRSIAQANRAVEFRRSGAIRYDIFLDALGQEKTVDVNLAVDLVRLREIYDMAIIVSGDQDYLPAVRAIKDLGKTAVNVAFEALSGKLLPGGAKRLNEECDWSHSVKHADFAGYLDSSRRLNLPKPPR